MAWLRIATIAYAPTSPNVESVAPMVMGPLAGPARNPALGADDADNAPPDTDLAWTVSVPDEYEQARSDHSFCGTPPAPVTAEIDVGDPDARVSAADTAPLGITVSENTPGSVKTDAGCSSFATGRTQTKNEN